MFPIYLNTVDADLREGTPDDAFFYIPDVLSNMGAEVTLTQAMIPNLRYNINSTNNVISYTGSGTGTITLAVGNYSDSTLAAAIQAALRAAEAVHFAALTVTISASTELITIDAGAAKTIGLAAGTTMDYEIGVILPVTAAQTIVGTYPVRLDGTTYVDICTEQLRTRAVLSGTTRNVLARIPISQNFGNIIYFESAGLDISLRSTVSDFQGIRIFLVDDRARPFRLPANAHCSYTFVMVPVRSVLQGQFSNSQLMPIQRPTPRPGEPMLSEVKGPNLNPLQGAIGTIPLGPGPVNRLQ